MALNLTINDPTDPGVSVNAYVRQVLNNRPRAGLGLGLHAEFLVYRSKPAANAGGQPLSTQPLTLDIAAELYDKLYPYLFSAEALSREGWNPDAVTYAFVTKYVPAFAEAAAELDEGQSVLDLGLPPELEAEIAAINGQQG